MCNPFRCFFSSDRERGLILPPPYESHLPKDLSTLRNQYMLSDHAVRSLQRCLIWRMAVDWKLQHHIEKYDRPHNLEYANFERNCGLFGCYVLGKRSSDVLKSHLERTLFGPGNSIGISRNLLELFILSIRQAEQYPLKRIACRRSAMMLVRLALDSSILIDLMSAETVFAKKLKVKCAKLHKEEFPWLLDPARINIGDFVKSRASDICNEGMPRGRWKETDVLMRECMRPCAALMDPSLMSSTLYEVNMSYLEPGADVGRQPEFMMRPLRTYRDFSPAAIVCGPVRWQNMNLSNTTAGPNADPAKRRSSKQVFRDIAATLYCLIKGT